jgi:hypothetical protein
MLDVESRMVRGKEETVDETLAVESLLIEDHEDGVK